MRTRDGCRAVLITSVTLLQLASPSDTGDIRPKGVGDVLSQMWHEYSGRFPVLLKVWHGCNRTTREQCIAYRSGGGGSTCLGATATKDLSGHPDNSNHAI
jgi:hypothetical protein